jgi:curved DNA-binding protein CbpA
MPLAELQLAEVKRAYQILGVPLTASAHSIKQTYRQLVKRWHPDRYPTGTAAHAEATKMMELINEAFAKIEHAPLRYHIEAIPLAPRNAARSAPAPRSESAGKNAETFPNTYRIEFWVRFACGALLGAFVSLDLVLNFTESSAVLVWGITCLTLGFGFASARYGDKFWYLVLRRWWLWP